MPRRRSPAISNPQPVPDIDRRDRRREIGQLLLGELGARLRINLVAHAPGEMRQRFGPHQRRALARRKLRRLAPDHDEIELVSRDAEAFALQDVELHAESAAVDLRSAQLDQFEQLPVDAGLAGRLAKRRDNVIGIRRQRLEVIRFAVSM